MRPTSPINAPAVNAPATVLTRRSATGRGWQWLAILALCLFAGLMCSGCQPRPVRAEDAAQDRQRDVIVVSLEDQTISPVTARYIERAIREAEEHRAECLVLVLDTPGGLVSSTREIVKDLLASRTCVVVYVSPRGAEAASAGGFITLAAHVAAMAPSTTIGAMHPVSIGGLPIPTQPPSDAEPKSPDEQLEDGEKQKPSRSPLEEKIVNNTAAWARALARYHGRNADWAERAVNESIVATESEALEAGVVDLVAVDLRDLLQKIAGREIAVVDDVVTLRTAEAEIRRFEMWWGDQLLAKIADPNVAFLLMIFGFYGILFEFYSPGWGVAGTLGVICLVLAGFGLSVLPINYTGLILIGVALAMFVAEVFVTSYGALAAGGIVCLAIGGLMLVDSPAGFTRVSVSVVAPVTAATAAITVFLVGSIVRTHRRKVQTGSEALLGTLAVSVGEFTPQDGQYRGTVRVHGELWTAIASQPVEAEQSVRICGQDGLTLNVEADETPAVDDQPSMPSTGSGTPTQTV